MTFRYNITKQCSCCGELFIVDFLSEPKADTCMDCKAIEEEAVNNSSYDDIKYELDILLNPCGSRKSAVWYD